jgi:hypothetical protein
MLNNKNKFEFLCEKSDKILYIGDSLLQLVFDFSKIEESTEIKSMIINQELFFDKNESITIDNNEAFFKDLPKISNCTKLEIFVSSSFLNDNSIYLFKNEENLFNRFLRMSKWTIKSLDEYKELYLFFVGDEKSNEAVKKSFFELPPKAYDILVAKDILVNLKQLSDYSTSKELIFFSKDIIRIPIDLSIEDIKSIKYYEKFLGFHLNSDEEKKRLFASALYNYLYNEIPNHRVSKLFENFDDIIMNYSANSALFYQRFDLYEIKIRFDISFSKIRKEANSTLSNIKGSILLIVSGIIAFPSLGIINESSSVLKNIIFFFAFAIAAILYDFIISQDLENLITIQENLDDTIAELDNPLIYKSKINVKESNENELDKLKGNKFISKIYLQSNKLSKNFSSKIQILEFCSVIAWIPALLFFLNFFFKII